MEKVSCESEDPVTDCLLISHLYLFSSCQAIVFVIWEVEKLVCML